MLGGKLPDCDHVCIGFDPNRKKFVVCTHFGFENDAPAHVVPSHNSI